MAQLSIIDKLFGSTTLSEQKAAMAKKTYALLSLSIVSCIAGAALSLGNETVMGVFKGETSFSPRLAMLLMFLIINAVPYIAIWASTKSTPLAVGMLVVDGLLSGVALSPLMYIAEGFASNGGFAQQTILGIELGPHALSIMAGVITLAMFLGLTGYVMLSKKRFSAPIGLMSGFFVGLIALMAINMLLNRGQTLQEYVESPMYLIISIGICLFGVLGLVYATSDVLNNPDFQNPVWGALMLFAAIFNIFVAILRILIRIAASRR